MNVRAEVRRLHVNDSICFTRLPGGKFRLEAVKLFPHSRERLFEVFSDAFQLEAITPPWLKFSVLTPHPIEIKTGTIIDYRLKLHGVPIRWQSRISLWEPPFRFVDEQTRGPYRRWHHEHLFEEVERGTLCRDVVDYAVIGGRAVEWLFVRRDLRRIFAFRQRKLMELLGPA